MKMLWKKIKKIMERLLIIVLLMGVILVLSEKTKKVQGATSENKTSVTAFATKEDLMNKFSPNKKGVAEAVGTLIFGKDYNASPMKWYILGKDTTVIGDNIVIFAASAITDKQTFNDDTSYKKFDSKFGVYEKEPAQVYSNHYGASEIRSYLQGLAMNESYFSIAEQSLMQYTTVTTKDTMNNMNYTTTDKLYLLSTDGVGSSYKYIKAGSNDKIKILLSTLGKIGNWFWLRTPEYDDFNYALDACPGYCADYCGVTYEAEVRPASRLNLSSVIFSSAATAASSDIVVVDSIAPGTAMTLRIDGRNKDIGIIQYNTISKKIVATKDTSATGTVSLIVQGNNGIYDWYYSKIVDGTEPTEVTMFEIAIALGISEVSYDDCKVWIETTDDDGLIYANMAEIGVKSVDINDISTPVPEKTLDTTATVTAIGIADTSKTQKVSWNINGSSVSGDVVYNTSYTASVTITLRSGYTFIDDVIITFNGKTVNKTLNEDGSITVSYTFDRTPKRNIINVTKPNIPDDNTFIRYYTEEDILVSGVSNGELGSTSTITFEGSLVPVTEIMDVEWTISNADGSGYDKTPGSVNTFKWVIKPLEYTNYNINEQLLSGTVDITNKAYTIITNTGINDKSLVFDENTIDLSDLFKIDSNAGERTYTIEEASTGEGTVNNSILTVTKTGTFFIRLSTGPNGIYEPSEVIANLVVVDGVILSAASGYNSVYDGDAHGITVTVSNIIDAVIKYSTDGINYSEDNPMFTNVGTNIVYYKIEKNNYVTVSGQQTISIVPLEVTFRADDQAIQWGEKIDSSPDSLLIPDGLHVVGDIVEAVVLTATTSELTDNGEIIINDVLIKNAVGDNVTYNYNISYITGKLTISHNTDLVPLKIEVTKTDVDYVSEQTLNVDDLVVTVFYEDSYSNVVTDYITNVADIDMSRIGKKLLTVTYTSNGKTVIGDVVIVVEHNTSLLPERIEVSNVDYKAGDDINLDATTITAYYADGFNKIVTDITSNADELDMSTVGNKVLTIFYTENGYNVSEDIVLTVLHNETSKPAKLEITKGHTEYTAGEYLDVSDIEVKVLYEDGYVKEVGGDYTTNASLINMFTVGEKILTVLYTEKGDTVTADINILVSHNEKLNMTDVEITKIKTEYVAGEELNFDDMVVKALFSDGFETLLTTYSSNASSLDISQIGDKILKVTVADRGVNITKDILIKVAHNKRLAPYKINVSGSYKNKEYKTGDVINKEDFNVIAHYEDGYSSVVSDFTTNIDKIDMLSIGEKTVIITYEENGKTITKEVIISVIHDDTLAPYKIEAVKNEVNYLTGNTLRIDDIEVTAFYLDGYSEKVTTYATNAKYIDMSTGGDKTLTVSYITNSGKASMDIIIYVDEPPRTGDRTDTDMNMWLLVFIICGITIIRFYRKKE